MKTERNQLTPLGALSLAVLVSAVVLILSVGVATWTLSTYTWPSMGIPMKHMFVDDKLLIDGVFAAVVLTAKEFSGTSTSLTLAVNALALVGILGFLVLYLCVNATVLLHYSNLVVAAG